MKMGAPDTSQRLHVYLNPNIGGRPTLRAGDFTIYEGFHLLYPNSVETVESLMVAGRYILTPIFMHQSIETVNGHRQLYFKYMKSNETRRANGSWLENNHSTV